MIKFHTIAAQKFDIFLPIAILSAFKVNENKLGFYIFAFYQNLITVHELVG